MVVARLRMSVYQDIILPVADAGSGGLITCEFATINIVGSASTNSGQTNVQWSTENGSILLIQTQKPIDQRWRYI